MPASIMSSQSSGILKNHSGDCIVKRANMAFLECFFELRPASTQLRLKDMVKCVSFIFLVSHRLPVLGGDGFLAPILEDSSSILNKESRAL